MTAPLPNDRQRTGTERAAAFPPLAPPRGPAGRLLLVAAVTLLGGCATHYELLRPAEEIVPLGRLQESGASLPSEIYFVEAGAVGGKPLRVAVEETGQESDGRLVVLLHGLISDRTAWDYLRGNLGRDHRLLMVDLPGCGDSDKPDPGRVGNDFYAPDELARRVLLALRARLESRGRPERITLVGHSLGGTVTLRMLGSQELASEFPDVLPLVDGAVLISPVDFSVEKPHPTFVEIATAGRAKMAAARMFGFLKRKVSRSAREGVSDPEVAAREEVDRTIEILRTRRTRRVAQAMILSVTPYDLRGKRPEWPEIEQLVADYRNVDVPALILWGARDETFPVSMGYKLRAQLPESYLRVVRESMHLLPSERPVLCAGLIRDFVADGGDSWAAVSEVPVPDRGRVLLARKEEREGRSQETREPVRLPPASDPLITQAPAGY